jgi:hypothetical protein
MGEILRILSRNREYVEIHREQPRDALTQAVAELFKAILCTLRLVVKYLTKSSTGKLRIPYPVPPFRRLTVIERAIKAVFRGDGFERELEEAIEEVRRLSDHASAEVNICHHDQSRRIEKRVDQISGNPQEVAEILYGFLISNPNYLKGTAQRK